MPVIVINNYFKPEYRCRACQIVGILEKLRRKCELYYFTEINKVTRKIKSKIIEAVVLSGSSAHLEDPANLLRYGAEIDFIREVNIPLLGICFGHQLIGTAFGSEIDSLPHYLQAFKAVKILEPNDLFSSWKRRQRILLCKSHKDFVKKLPSNFLCLANSKDCEIEAMKHNSLPIYGVQAHIERTLNGCKDGLLVLENFLKNVVDVYK